MLWGRMGTTFTSSATVTCWRCIF